MKFLASIAQITASASLVSLLACHGSPLTSIDNRQITKVSISKGQGQEISIDSINDINFIVSHLSHLRTNSDIKVHPEFRITFFSAGGNAIILRLGRDCIGPNVPASQYTKRWYFQNSELYDFICAKFSGSNQ